MPRFSPLKSFLLRAVILLVLLAVAWCWPPIVPKVDPPRLETMESQKPAVQFATNEEAVVFAFERFAAEQHDDGSWGVRDDAGEAIEPATTESTSLVLLAFASAGQTHRQGKYKDQVQRGLDYLLNAGKVDDELKPRRLMLPGRGHTTRSQALATLAICRMYSKSGDTQWARTAQFAVDELCQASHRPQLNDATGEVVFWQLLALLEAHMSYLNVPVDVAADLQKWYSARIQSMPESSWRGTDFVAIRKFALLSHQRFKPPIQRFIERRLEQDPVVEQFATATAFVEINYAEVGEPLQRLKESALARFPREAVLSELALRVLILNSRLYKLPPSMQAPEDDFPLMTKHEDL